MVVDNFSIRCVAELPLNDKALKHNRFTIMEKYAITLLCFYIYMYGDGLQYFTFMLVHVFSLK